LANAKSLEDIHEDDYDPSGKIRNENKVLVISD